MSDDSIIDDDHSDQWSQLEDNNDDIDDYGNLADVNLDEKKPMERQIYKETYMNVKNKLSNIDTNDTTDNTSKSTSLLYDNVYYGGLKCNF